jgi:phenylacetate-CoA ligase
MTVHSPSLDMPAPSATDGVKLDAASTRKQLQRLIQGAQQRVPFYSRHWAAGATPVQGMHFPEDLRQLPVVHKSDLLKQPVEDLLDSAFSNHQLATEKTSGSSGQPMEIYKDPATARRRGLRFLRALLSCGYRPGQKLMLISTRRNGGLMSYARWHYVDLRDEQLLQEYQTLRPDALYGPLTSLLQIAEAARKQSVTLHRPAFVIGTAEQMLPYQRELLETGFGCPVGDFYGMTEVGLVAFRRPRETAFEMGSGDLLLEYLPLGDDQRAERLVITDLSGGAMPMIRYDTGDLVIRDPERPHAPIQGFVGRRVDSIKLASGAAVSPYRVTLRLEIIVGLRQYQIVQRKDLSIDAYFHCDEPDAPRVREALSAAIAELCTDLTVRLHFQKHSLHKVAGKFRPVQSEARSDT